MKNFLVVGVGPHARRTHLPALAAGQASGLVGTMCGVDLLGATDVLVPYDADDGPRSLPVTLIEPFDSRLQALPDRVRHALDTVVERRSIHAVVVSTEPAYHMVYTRWALERGLSVLLDKPLSVHADASTDPRQAGAILTDFDDIMECYRQTRHTFPQLMVTVQSQRRYHPAFWRIRECIAEVAAETSCPVTSIQSFHSDGQWRMPDEMIDLSYHGFDRGTARPPTAASTSSTSCRGFWPPARRAAKNSTPSQSMPTSPGQATSWPRWESATTNGSSLPSRHAIRTPSPNYDRRHGCSGKSTPSYPWPTRAAGAP